MGVKEMGLFSGRKAKAGKKDEKRLRIILEHAGTPLYELHSEDYNREIVIGRNPECTWHLDHVDHSASSKHAMISRRKNHFYLTDLGSRNGIYFQNQRIQERKLEIGDKINLGECQILVEEVTENQMKISRFHRLVYTDKNGKRNILEITKPETVIGSAPESDVVFPDPLVSSRHAVLQLKSDGSCWIRDLGSRNGTTVNGDELMSDNERMLQDNDLISIAYLDIRFWDASGTHQESRVWPAVIAIAVTIAVILAGYIGYSKLTPNASKLIEIATLEMQAGRLDSARKILNDSVPYAEGSADVTYQRDQLLRRLDQWEMVIKIWAQVRKNLENGNFTRAVQDLGGIGEGDMNSWTWKGGAQEKKKAAAVKRLLDACSASAASLQSSISTMSDVENNLREFRLAMAEAGRFKEPYFPLIRKYAKPYLDKMEKTLSDDRELQQTLLMLNMSRPDYPAVIRRLDKISRESSGPVKQRADRVLPAVTVLDRETRRTLAMVDKVCELDFKTVDAFKLDLPEGIDYSTEKNIGSLRNQLIDTVERFKDTALQLSIIHRSLVKQGVVPGKNLALLESFRNPENLKLVYQADSLNLPLPKKFRKEPAGVYDRLLGIEYFYDYLNNIHNHSMTLNPDELPFKPELMVLRDILGGIDRFVNYSDKDENQWFNRGAFADYLVHCKELLKKRDEIIAAQQKMAAAPDSREFIISRGIAAYLAPDGQAKREIELKVEKAFGALKRKILILNRDFNMAMPEDAIVIRGKIIAVGLPGDSIVKKMWQQRPTAGWGK